MFVGLGIVLAFLGLVCSMVGWIFYMERRCRHRWKVWYGYTNRHGRRYCVYKCPVCGAIDVKERN